MFKLKDKKIITVLHSKDLLIVEKKLSSFSGIFLGLVWGRISAPSLSKMSKNLPKMLYSIPKFLVLHFGENCTKIWTKIAKLQMHENLHKNVNFYANFHEFYEEQLMLQICYILTLLISYMVFNPFKMAVQFFSTSSNFPNFDGPNAFFQIQQAPER